MIADAVGAILLASVTLYAVLGGADFGGGIWDLFAGTTRDGHTPRALIDETITPVWEANHVWLIFDLVIFWTGFPHAFAAVMNAAAPPIWLAVAGVVLRGVGFAFRKEVTRLGLHRAAGAAFGFSSLLTPFLMGTVVGAIATGHITADATHASQPAWTSTTSLLSGFLFAALCAYLAAVYLISEAARRDDRRLERYFTRRAHAAATIAGALALATLAELHTANPALYERLTGRAVGLMVLAGVCGLAVPALLTTGQRAALVRVIAALAVAAVIWGWGRPIPGTAARHHRDPDPRRRPACHPGRPRRPLRRRRRADRTILPTALNHAEPARPPRGTGRTATSDERTQPRVAARAPQLP